MKRAVSGSSGFSGFSYDESLLKRFLDTPTAPFRENRIRSLVKEVATERAIPFFEDPHGNIVLGVATQGEYAQRVREGGRDVRLFIAHMDHPGFHGVKWEKNGHLSAQWHGGGPLKKLVGAPVWLSSHSEIQFGRVTKAKLTPTKRTIESVTISLDKKSQSSNITATEATELYGGFHFGSFSWTKGNTIYTKAADDLVGSFVILQLAEWCQRHHAAAPFLGLLTRGEEVGFIGAIAHFGLGWLRGYEGGALCVSLETSRMLPGAQAGKGPVVRLGDRATVFSSSESEYLRQLAVKTLGARFQRRIMDGGTCEGTVAISYGFPTAAISIPLGNYHNQSIEGGPKSRGKDGPAPEFVDRRDIDGMFRLCQALVSEPELRRDPWKEKRASFTESGLKYRSLMDRFQQS